MGGFSEAPLKGPDGAVMLASPLYGLAKALDLRAEYLSGFPGSPEDEGAADEGVH